MRTFNNIVSEPQYYYEIQLYSNNEVNIMPVGNGWDEIISEYYLNNVSIGDLDPILKYLKEKYNPPTKINK